MLASAREDELIPRAVSGDLSAIELLLHLHHVQLLSYIRRRFPQRLSGVLEPQDILQDTWLRAVNAIQNFRPSGNDSVHRWLTTIARNVITDHLKYRSSIKHGGRHISVAGNDAENSIVWLLEELVVYRRTPSRSAMHHELVASLESALARLPDDQAMALKLRHFESCSIKEIARRMKRSEGSVLMLCNRGLKTLQSEMKSASMHL